MKVTITEVGMRDGLQNEAIFVPTHEKMFLIKELQASGIINLELTSMVHPKWVLQLSDAERVLEDIDPDPDIIYMALVPNLRGAERALVYDHLKWISVVVSASETHNQRNLNRSREESLKEIGKITKIAHSKGKFVRGYISTLFGCPYEGDVPESEYMVLCERLLEYKIDELSLGDTIGVATPLDINQVVNSITSICQAEKLVMHLHDTRGMGLVNAYKALELGIRSFDTAFGGFGGCPYAPGATGNLATEDLVYLLEGLGIRTNIDLDKLSRCSIKLGKLLEKQPPSKVVAAYRNQVLL